MLRFVPTLIEKGMSGSFATMETLAAKSVAVTEEIELLMMLDKFCEMALAVGWANVMA